MLPWDVFWKPKMRLQPGFHLILLGDWGCGSLHHSPSPSSCMLVFKEGKEMRKGRGREKKGDGKGWCDLGGEVASWRWGGMDAPKAISWCWGCTCLPICHCACRYRPTGNNFGVKKNFRLNSRRKPVGGCNFRKAVLSCNIISSVRLYGLDWVSVLAVDIIYPVSLLSGRCCYCYHRAKLRELDAGTNRRGLNTIFSECVPVCVHSYIFS